MSFTDHFSVVDDTVGPQPWMQMRGVASTTTPSVSKSYDPSDGWPKNEGVQAVQTQWTNNTPGQQWVYGMVTRGGAQVSLQCRSRGYLSERHAIEIADDPDLEDFEMFEVSRFGVGADIGVGGILALGSAFAVAEYRENSRTIPLMPAVAGWALLEPGDTLNARVEVLFKSDFWENTAIDGGDTGTESKIITGELRLDLFAVPTVSVALPRITPTIVGGAGNIQHDEEIDLGIADTQTIVDVPTGLAEGDVLVAIVANNFGLSAEMAPVEAGWTLAHSRMGWWGDWGDVHMKIFGRTVQDPGDEPATYAFDNGLLAEQIAVIIPLRGSIPFDNDEGGNWHIASNVSTWKFVEDQIAPSVERNGQLLISASYFHHIGDQSPITQTPPAGMTEVIDIPGAVSTLAIATLVDPPNPTLSRQFTPSVVPTFNGHSITATILVPGEQQF